jgi:lincosamide nucleotidyltransferase A/C/D/E
VLAGAGIVVWVDGGWGVDALLGEQTREHADLDLAVDERDLAALRAVLEARGYACDGTGWNVVMTDARGRVVDIHAFHVDERGDAVLGDPAEGNAYPAGALTGAGALGGFRVRCVAAPFVLGFRNAFPPRDVDRADVDALCARFGLETPSRFAQPDDES